MARDLPGLEGLDLRATSIDRQAKGLKTSLAQGHQRNQYRIARMVVVLFSSGFFAALVAIIYTIVRGTYQESYLTLLSTIGVLWGSVIGSVAGFYFAKQSDGSGE